MRPQTWPGENAYPTRLTCAASAHTLELDFDGGHSVVIIGPSGTTYLARKTTPPLRLGGNVSGRVLVEEQEVDKPRTKRLRIRVKEDVLQVELKQIARKLSRQLRIPGFRPGRAPYPLVERLVGREQLLQQFLEQNADALVREAMDSLSLSGHEATLVELEQDPVALIVEVHLKPEVDLGDYRNIHIPFEPPTVTEQDVDAAISSLLEERAVQVPVEGPAVAGDFLEAEVTIRVRDITVVSREMVTLDLGGDMYLPGMAEQLMGIQAGETRTFTLDIPEHHAWQEHGDRAEVRVTVQEVKRLNLPELTLELAQEFNPDVQSVEELRDIVAENLRRQREAEATNAYARQVWQALEERATVSYPPILLERALDQAIADMKKYIENIGMTWENYLKNTGKTEEELREEQRPEVEKMLVRELLVARLVEVEKLEVGEEEVAQVLAEAFQGYHQPLDDIERRLQGDTEFARSVQRRALELRVLKHLMAIARGELEAREGEPEAGGEVPGEHVGEEEAPPTVEMAEAVVTSEVMAESDLDVAVETPVNEEAIPTEPTG